MTRSLDEFLNKPWDELRVYNKETLYDEQIKDLERKDMTKKGQPLISKIDYKPYAEKGKVYLASADSYSTNHYINGIAFDKKYVEPKTYFRLKCLNSIGVDGSLLANKEYIGWNNYDKIGYDYHIINEKGKEVIYKTERFQVLEKVVPKDETVPEPVTQRYENKVVNKTADKLLLDKFSNFDFGKEKAMSTTDTILKHAFHGVKVGAAAEAGNLVLDVVKPIVGEDNILLATEEGRQLTKFLVASGLLYLCNQKDGFIPKAEYVAPACEMVIEAAARDLLQPHMGDIRAALEKLAATAMVAGKERLGMNEETRVPMSEFVNQTVREAVPVAVR